MRDVSASFGSGDGPLDSHPALPSAAAAVAVADPAQPVAAESCIGASDRDAEYGDGVERVRQSRLSRWQEQR